MIQTIDSQIFRNIFLILNVAPTKSVLIIICLDQCVKKVWLQMRVELKDFRKIHPRVMFRAQRIIMNASREWSWLKSSTRYLH
jgi:hypothetical protein